MNIDMSINGLRKAYQCGDLTPKKVTEIIREKIAQYENHNVWIHVLTEEELLPYISALDKTSPDTLPLWGIPFAIKDNIDLAGISTTAGCPDFAYTPSVSAAVVQNLVDAGAIPIGKTNLDQFATGLNGTRSPFGACRNSFDEQYISGGSSSGSAVSVALGMATFSLGTDTAGSGRVPACFNNLVGVKPTLGLLSATGLVPACRSLDTISIFAYNTDDANTVLASAEAFDERDGYSRENPFSNQSRQYGLRDSSLKVGIIPEDQLQFFGDEAYQRAYQKTLQALQKEGFDCVEIDYQPFNEAAKLLYEGPWVTERYLATQPLIDEKPEAIFPVVRDIVAPGKEPKATELFKAQYRLKELRIQCVAQLQQVDCLLTPTAGRFFTIEEMLAEPILCNSQLGYYTNFMNLLDFSAVSVPTVFTESGLPFGITLVADAFSDRQLLSIANRIQQQFDLPMGALNISQLSHAKNNVINTNTIEVLVCGAHLNGLPLNWQLTERGAVLKSVTQTAAKYRMYALAGGPPYRPGLIKDDEAGAAIDVEIWSMPMDQFGSFVAAIPAPLGIGKVELDDGRLVSGFICEPYGIDGAEEITHLGGWRAYIA
jgi:allophanate hydrolase